MKSIFIFSFFLRKLKVNQVNPQHISFIIINFNIIKKQSQSIKFQEVCLYRLHTSTNYKQTYKNFFIMSYCDLQVLCDGQHSSFAFLSLPFLLLETICGINKEHHILFALDLPLQELKADAVEAQDVLNEQEERTVSLHELNA